MKGFVKDPQATLDYAIDWTLWLDGDEINTSNWTAESGITITPGSPDFTTTVASVYISGGVEGSDYTLKNTITTVGGRTDERTLLIKIRNR